MTHWKGLLVSVQCGRCGQVVRGRTRGWRTRWAWRAHRLGHQLCRLGWHTGDGTVVRGRFRCPRCGALHGAYGGGVAP